MIILGIETSCDETAAAVIENGTTILSNVVASSSQMHAKTGGIIPEQAARQQVLSIIPVIKQALSEAKLSWNITTPPKIDAIAVTAGPGLIGSLLVGVETAKTLSLLWQKPLVPVNHLVGHIYANWLQKSELPQFPCVALVVSGGHTDMVLMRKHQDIEWIGGTRDDAAGEAFDKTARLLNLPYPGGPHISQTAQQFREHYPHTPLTLFPRPLKDDNSFDFSFSGLKTAVLREVNQCSDLTAKTPQFAAEIENAIVEVLVDKTLKAAKQWNVASIVLGGGVAANSYLRQIFVSEKDTKGVLASFHVPDPKLCTDNAAYIASAAYFNYQPIEWQRVNAFPELTITATPVAS